MDYFNYISSETLSYFSSRKRSKIISTLKAMENHELIDSEDIREYCDRLNSQSQKLKTQRILIDNTLKQLCKDDSLSIFLFRNKIIIPDIKETNEYIIDNILFTWSVLNRTFTENFQKSFKWENILALLMTGRRSYLYYEVIEEIIDHIIANFEIICGLEILVKAKNIMVFKNWSFNKDLFQIATSQIATKKKPNSLTKNGLDIQLNWKKSIHSLFPCYIQQSIKTLIMLNHKNTIIIRPLNYLQFIPKEILFVICELLLNGLTDE